MEMGLLPDFLGIFPRDMKDIIFCMEGSTQGGIEPMR